MKNFEPPPPFLLGANKKSQWLDTEKGCFYAKASTLERSILSPPAEKETIVTSGENLSFD